MKYVIYLRVSTEYQDVEAQRKMCKDYLAQKPPSQVLEFQEIDVSGDIAIDKRLGLGRALTSLSRGDKLLVSSRDRLGRDPILNMMIEMEISKRGATLECVNLNLDGFNKGTAELMKTILDGFAKFEKFMIGFRTKNKLAQIKDSGFRTGRVPYGYQLGQAFSRTVITPKGEQEKVSYKLVKNEAEYAILCKMEEWALRLVPRREIAERLRRENIKNREGKPFSHVSIHKILTNAPSHRQAYLKTL
jgi:DNA invertase Pin-like site-specific DNA recombinase